MTRCTWSLASLLPPSFLLSLSTTHWPSPQSWETREPSLVLRTQEEEEEQWSAQNTEPCRRDFYSLMDSRT